MINVVFNWLFFFYELWLCITELTTQYCIHTLPAHLIVFPLHYSPPFHCHHAQLTLRILGKDSYHFTFALPTPLFYSPRFCVHSPCLFCPPLHIKNYTPSLKPISFHYHYSPSRSKSDLGQKQSLSSESVLLLLISHTSFTTPSVNWTLQ